MTPYIQINPRAWCIWAGTPIPSFCTVESRSSTNRKERRPFRQCGTWSSSAKKLPWSKPFCFGCPLLSKASRWSCLFLTPRLPVCPSPFLQYACRTCWLLCAPHVSKFPQYAGRKITSNSSQTQPVPHILAQSPCQDYWVPNTETLDTCSHLSMLILLFWKCREWWSSNFILIVWWPQQIQMKYFVSFIQ